MEIKNILIPRFLTNLFELDSGNKYIDKEYLEFEKRPLLEEDKNKRYRQIYKALNIWDLIRSSNSYLKHDINDPFLFASINIITSYIICSILGKNSLEIRPLIKEIAIDLLNDNDLLNKIKNLLNDNSQFKQVKEVLRNFKRIGTRKILKNKKCLTDSSFNSENIPFEERSLFFYDEKDNLSDDLFLNKKRKYDF